MKSNRPAAPLGHESYTTEQLKTALAIRTKLETQDKFYKMPTSSGSNLLMKTLGAGGNIAALPEANKQISNSQQITVKGSGTKRQIISKGKNTETIIEVGDIEMLLGSNKAAKKMFPYLLIKMNEQCYTYENKALYKDEVGFPLQELVDIGFYKDVRAARRGFAAAMNIITSLKLKAVVKKGKKSLSTVGEGGDEDENTRVMFTGFSVVNSYCKVDLNYKISWQPLFEYFTILPKFAFRLKNKPFELLFAISYLARQNNKNLKEKGFFTISFRTIQQQLHLPSEIKNNDPFKTIRKPIEDAITEIEEHLAAQKEPDYVLHSVYDVRDSVKDYLEKGYLKVEPKGSCAEYFIEQSNRRGRKIAAAADKQRAIVEKAMAGAIQKKIEAIQGE